MQSHNSTVVDQFTRQAEPFAAARPIRDADSLQALTTACRASASDVALDVACGPGIVTCAFSRHVALATGVDLTPAMIRKARILATAGGLGNAHFVLGDVQALPFAEVAFSIVTSRYAFHHLLQPAVVLREMSRVCRPGGRVAVMDMMAPIEPAKAHRFDQMERLRDPSHVRALTADQIAEMFSDVGLPEPVFTRLKMTVELEALLKTSFPNDGDADRVRALVTSSIHDNGLGVDTREQAGRIVFDYPIGLWVAAKSH